MQTVLLFSYFLLTLAHIPWHSILNRDYDEERPPSIFRHNCCNQPPRFHKAQSGIWNMGKARYKHTGMLFKLVLFAGIGRP